MASIIPDPNGRKRILFKAPNGKRSAIRLGIATMKQAETFTNRLDAILADKLLRRPHDQDTAKWLADLDESLLRKLRDFGLVDGVGVSDVTLKEMLDRVFKALAGKQSTLISYGNVRRNLESHFGEGRAIRSITPEAAELWRKWMVDDQKLATPTISRRVIAARTIWRKAIRFKLASENPFTGLKSGTQANEARGEFIPQPVIDDLIARAPDTEWAVIIALARYGGLRTPSEHYALRWGDVDFEAGELCVSSPKTEHHEGGASRLVPIHPKLRTPLMKLFDETATEGNVHVINRHRKSLNLRQQFCRIIRRAGAKQWPRLFHNLRASCESEWADKYGLATACRWSGNSPQTAAKHYLRPTNLDADFRDAAGLKQAAQKAAHHTVTQRHVGSQKQGGKPRSVTTNDAVTPGETHLMGRTGREHTTDITGFERIWTDAAQIPAHFEEVDLVLLSIAERQDLLTRFAPEL